MNCATMLLIAALGGEVASATGATTTTAPAATRPAPAPTTTTAPATAPAAMKLLIALEAAGVRYKRP